MSVVTPFYGGTDEAIETRDALLRIALRAGDEVIVADNTPDGAFAALESHGAIVVVEARHESSSYYARNAGAEQARNDWLLFIDADCRPPADIVDAYFATPPNERCGAIAGEVVGAPTQTSLVSRYSRARGHLGQRAHVEFGYRPFAITANMLVRRSAWQGIGGFQEGIRSGADAEFSWRLQDAGWTLEYAPQAALEHMHRETIRQLARQAGRVGAGRAWINRRYRGSHSRPKILRRLGRCAAGVVVWTLAGQFDRAKFKGLDAVFIVSEGACYFLSNRVARSAALPGRATERGTDVSVVVWADQFPALSETFISNEVRALRDAGHHVRVEAGARPARPDRDVARQLDTTYLEDDGILRKFVDRLWLVARHPVRCWRDVVARRRWSKQEDAWPLLALASPARRLVRGGELHVHAHFATGAALNAMRLSRLLGIPYSVATHGFDIYKSPRNLVEKHVGAAFAVTDSEYSARYLRELVGAPHAARIHKLILGVDTERFRRTRPYPGGRQVTAVARLVEKKGLQYLIEAAAEVELDAVTIVGEGPLRGDLEAQIRSLRLEATVELRGWDEPERVRALLERTDLLVMPCVVAADGDRDTMPVVVKEALSMEIPVICSDEVGLSELIEPAWGRLVPPADATALARAIEEVLSLPPQTRAAMGRAGREMVMRRADLRRETERLVELLRATVAH